MQSTMYHAIFFLWFAIVGTFSATCKNHEYFFWLHICQTCPRLLQYDTVWFLYIFLDVSYMYHIDVCYYWLNADPGNFLNGYYFRSRFFRLWIQKISVICSSCCSVFNLIERCHFPWFLVTLLNNWRYNFTFFEMNCFVTFLWSHFNIKSSY